MILELSYTDHRVLWRKVHLGRQKLGRLLDACSDLVRFLVHSWLTVGSHRFCVHPMTQDPYQKSVLLLVLVDRWRRRLVRYFVVVPPCWLMGHQFLLDNICLLCRRPSAPGYQPPLIPGHMDRPYCTSGLSRLHESHSSLHALWLWLNRQHQCTDLDRLYIPLHH